MADATASIQAHYGSGDLVGRIMGALKDAGHDTANPTVEMLNLVDQVHGGGLNATKDQAELASIGEHTRVLDAGCGVGGSGRYLAHTYGCRIEGIDLTPEFVETAGHLNKLCGLDHRISVRQGSVTDLPYKGQSFDLVWCQNVTMNIEDKPGLFAEAYRVLVPGGHYTFSHAARGAAGEPYYPLPWATGPSYSYLATPEQVLGWLADAGFETIENRYEGGGAPRARPAGELGSGIIMGPDVSERHANSARSVQEGRLARMLVSAVRPA